MDIIDKIDLLMNERKLKNKDIAEYLALKPQVVTDWRAGRSRSYEKYLPQIASFFGVSMEYLIGETLKKDNAKISDTRKTGNTTGEDDMLKKYRILSEKGKKKAVDYLNDLMFNPENISVPEKSYLPTAAFDGRFTVEAVEYSREEIEKILNSDDIEGEDF